MSAIRVPREKTIVLGHYELTTAGLKVKGRPSFEEHVQVGEFIQRTHRASGFWLGDWLRYGESRGDWEQLLAQAEDATGLSQKTLRNVRAVAAISPDLRNANVEFSQHAEVAGLPPREQAKFLELAETERLTSSELRKRIRASKRKTVVDGQAVLLGRYGVIYVAPSWSNITIADLMKLPVEAHAAKDAVLLMWTPPGKLLENPGPRDVLEAWGFRYRTNRVWDKVKDGTGEHAIMRHEHLVIATRGTCAPANPERLPDSVLTERVNGDLADKPESVRKDIERLYDGPYLELLGRKSVKGWTVVGSDPKQWQKETKGES